MDDKIIAPKTERYLIEMGRDLKWVIENLPIHGRARLELDRLNTGLKDYQQYLAPLYNVFLTRADLELYVCYDAHTQELIARATYAMSKHPSGEHGLLYNLIVSEPYRRKGIGTALVQQVLRECQKPTPITAAVPMGIKLVPFIVAVVPEEYQEANLFIQNFSFDSPSYKRCSFQKDSADWGNIYRLYLNPVSDV